MSTKLIGKLHSQTPNPDCQGVEDVTVDEVFKAKNQVRIVDVRRPDEWIGEYGHIAEAEHIILDLLPQKISDLDPEETIVFVCRSGARSARAAQFAKQNGFQNVFNMKGGMIAWTEKKFPASERNGT